MNWMKRKGGRGVYAKKGRRSMTVGPQAIETVFKGYRFRSRLEARIAVMLDVLNLKWEYEAQGFALGGNCVYYLPDFWLPDLHCFIEVKGQEPTDEEQQKCIALARETRSLVLLLAGMPDTLPHGLAYYIHRDYGLQDGLPAHFIQCAHCGMVGIEADTQEQSDAVRFIPCDCQATVRHNADVIRRSVFAARAARFEHGEKP